MQLPVDKSLIQKIPLLDPGTRNQGQCDQLPWCEGFRSGPLAGSLCHPSRLAEMNWGKVGTSILGESSPAPDPCVILFAPENSFARWGLSPSG